MEASGSWVQGAREKVEILLSEAQAEDRWGRWCWPWMERQVNRQLVRPWHTENHSDPSEIDLFPPPRNCLARTGSLHDISAYLFTARIQALA